MSFFLFPPLLVFVLVIIIFVMILRAVAQAASSGGTTRPQPQVTTQSVEDGFWILSCPAAAEDIIYYHYWAKGARHSGQISYQPDAQGRQFVYTGEQPEQVSIVRIGAVIEDTSPSILPPVIGTMGGMWDSDNTPSQPSSPPSSGFPSAY